MWIHILIFMVILGVFLAGKMGRLPPEAGNPEEKKLFIRIALTGNIIGMLLTFQSGGDKVYSSGYRMEKEETGAYEEKFKVSVDGEEAGSLYVQVPEKETEGSEEEPETELSEEQQREKELQDMIVQYNQKKNDPQYYYLPDEWNGKHLEWEQPKDKTGNLLSALGLAAAAAAVIAKKREEQNAQIKRREQMLMDYPGLIMKFTLLVQAGLTARKAFQKIALDYGKREDGKKREAYEEIRVACYEMDSGISEAEAYRRFGERCGQVKYKTLSTLLIQNLQKGSRYLADLLEKESVEAWEERKRKARVLGDTAATKLLMILIGVLYLDFFVHDRAYLTAAAYEAAVSGSMEGYKKKGNIYEKADIQGRMLGDIGLPGGENLSMQTNAGKTVKVTYRLEVPAGFLGQKWKLEVSGKAKPLRPVGWIRKVKGTVDMLGEVTP